MRLVAFNRVGRTPSACSTGYTASISSLTTLDVRGRRISAFPCRHGRRFAARRLTSRFRSRQKVRQANKSENMKNMDAQLASNSPKKRVISGMRANKSCVFPDLDAAVSRNRRTNNSHIVDLFASLTSVGIRKAPAPGTPNDTYVSPRVRTTEAYASMVAA